MRTLRWRLLTLGTRNGPLRAAAYLLSAAPHCADRYRSAHAPSAATAPRAPHRPLCNRESPRGLVQVNVTGPRPVRPAEPRHTGTAARAAQLHRGARDAAKTSDCGRRAMFGPPRRAQSYGRGWHGDLRPAGPDGAWSSARRGPSAVARRFVTDSAAAVSAKRQSKRAPTWRLLVR